MAITLNEAKKFKRVAIYVVAVCVLVVACIAGYDYWHLRREAEHLAEEAKAGPHVDTTVAAKSPSQRTLSLVGEARPFASVHALRQGQRLP